MTLENIMRGSGDIGAMLSTAWGVRQLDADTNLVHVENVKARDFSPPKPFRIQGRPHIDESGNFKVVAQPGEAGSFADAIKRRGGRKKGEPEWLERAVELKTEQMSFEDVTDALRKENFAGVSRSKVRHAVNAYRKQQALDGVVSVTGSY